jgi:hypothetical protein
VFLQRHAAPRLQMVPVSAQLLTPRVGKNPGLKKTSPVGFIGFYWVLGFLGFFWFFSNFRVITDIFLPIFGLYKFFFSKKYLK